MFSVRNDPLRRTIYVRFTGLLRRSEVEAWAAEYRRLTDAYGGKRHVVYADMRGLAPLDQESAGILGDAIAYARRRGVRACVHLSDSTVQRLQAARIARDASPDDDVTIDVDSEAEAESTLAHLHVALVSNWSLSRQDVLRQCAMPDPAPRRGPGTDRHEAMRVRA
jgi:hypothetical protein